MVTGKHPSGGRAIVIVGPTAVGKTELSLQLAEEFDGEVINADSMQLYRGMDIGTAKLPLDQRRAIVHHMLDVLDVTETANVADFQRDARVICQQLSEIGKTPVIVGGSGLFVQGLLDDLQFPGSDPQIREELMAQAEELGAETMYAKLVDLDPKAAQNILPTNERRIIRALEVIALTGVAPVTSLQQLPEVVPSIRIGLTRSREDLDERIAQRVNDMWQMGFVDEVRHLETQGLRDGLTASKALGYAQILDYLSGIISEAEAKERTIAATRRFVRRQESWFKRDPRINWITADDSELVQKATELITNSADHEERLD